MISLKSVAHCYAKPHQISFPDWTVESGSQWLLLGASGSGKTTLLHILTGILQPSQGQVSINNTELYALSPRALDRFRGQHIGIVFQQPHLIKSLTVSENLLVAQSFAGLSPNKSRIKEVLESLHIADKEQAYPDQLSQGQLQRVSIARATINKPTLLIADEPTSSLDDKNAEAVLQLLLQQSALNEATLIIATHDHRVKNAFTNTYQLA